MLKPVKTSNGDMTFYPHGMASSGRMQMTYPYSQMHPVHWHGLWWLFPRVMISWRLAPKSEAITAIHPMAETICHYIVAAATIWGSRLANHRITFNCDNLAIINSSLTLKASPSAILHRCIHYFTVHLMHVPGSQNSVPDCLSRN